MMLPETIVALGLALSPAAVELACEGRTASEEDLAREGFARRPAAQEDPRRPQSPLSEAEGTYQLQRGAQSALCVAGRCCVMPERSALSPHVLEAQSDMPVIPPPGRGRPQPSQQPPRPAATIDDLARMGFDVKAIERAGQTEGRFVVMMQRAGEIRACLMRIELQRGQPPQRQSACF